MTGAERIAKERRRQIEEECHFEEDDDRYKRGELVRAAVCYAASSVNQFTILEPFGQYSFKDPWPWDRSWDKRSKHTLPGGAFGMQPAQIMGLCRQGKIKKLTIAGALIAAEIDRLQRIQVSTE